MLNADLPRGTMEWIEEHPERHDQECRYEKTPPRDHLPPRGTRRDPGGASSPSTPLDDYRTWYVRPDGQAVDRFSHTDSLPVETCAQAAPGLTGDLFDQDRTVPEPRLSVDARLARPEIDGEVVHDRRVVDSRTGGREAIPDLVDPTP